VNVRLSGSAFGEVAVTVTFTQIFTSPVYVNSPLTALNSHSVSLSGSSLEAASDGMLPESVYAVIVTESPFLR
jgi:hypothetical protein